MAFGRLPSRPRAAWSDWLTLHEAEERAGPRRDRHWTGTERVAPSAAEQAAELAAIFKLKPMQLAAVAKRWGIEPPDLTGHGSRRRGAELRERIVEAIEAAYAPAEPTRLRRRRVYDLVRAKILAGELRVGLRMSGDNDEPESPSLQELAAHFPAVGEDRIRLPRLGNVPALALIHVEDLDRAIPAQPLVSENNIAAAVDRTVSPTPTASGPQPHQPGMEIRTASDKPTERGKPGPKTARTAKAAAELLRQLTAGTRAPEALEKVSALSLAKELGLGETAAARARKEALAQLPTFRNSAE